MIVSVVILCHERQRAVISKLHEEAWFVYYVRYSSKYKTLGEKGKSRVPPEIGIHSGRKLVWYHATVEVEAYGFRVEAYWLRAEVSRDHDGYRDILALAR
jgi:hypothetical protein